MLAARLDRESPLEVAHLLEAEHPGEPLRDLELSSGLDESVVDHLREDLRVTVAEDDPGAAR
jgi:hypothetical protein